MHILKALVEVNGMVIPNFDWEPEFNGLKFELKILLCVDAYRQISHLAIAWDFTQHIYVDFADFGVLKSTHGTKWSAWNVMYEIRYVWITLITPKGTCID